MRAALAAALLTAGAACVPADGPLMAAGQDCLACHDGGEAPRWSAAGTWLGEGHHVTLRDASGRTLTLRTNQAGNWYTAERLDFPLRASVDGLEMPKDVTYGGCNRCHGRGGPFDTGPLMLPGRDCLACHDGTVGPPQFTAAGTWAKEPGRTATVTIIDANGTTVTRATNEVGNFYVYASDATLTPPLRISVDGEEMEPLASHGSCNRCHGPGGEAHED